jgi:uncharacterized protein YndB with AHSA1/START domain
MAKEVTLKFKRTVAADPAAVYRAFTNSSALREWFCDTALVEPRAGGRFYFAWNNGHYATGEFTRMDGSRKLALTWHGRGEPHSSSVRISIAEKKTGTGITVTHEGLGGGKKWGDRPAQIGRGWEAALENLQSVLETGEDRRFTMRPMLGVAGLEPLDAEAAARLGTPAIRGLRIDGVVPGMGAEAAGLQKDDVLVSLAGQKVADYGSVFAALQQHRAGEAVPVVIYRGGEELKLTLELSKRPLPPVPGTAVELSEAVRATYNEVEAELDESLTGATEHEAARRPAPDQWSAQETLAHLIQDEREKLSWITDVLGGSERWYDTYPSNSLARVEATVAAAGSTEALVRDLKQLDAETVALLAALPPEFVARKGSFWRVATNTLQSEMHTREHLEQIRAAVAAARS